MVLLTAFVLTVLIPPPAIMAAPVIVVPFPVKDNIPALSKVTDPPKSTGPPPDIPVPGVIVIVWLVIEEFPMSVKVLVVPLIDLLVNVCSCFSNTKVSAALVKEGIMALVGVDNDGT